MGIMKSALKPPLDVSSTIVPKRLNNSLHRYVVYGGRGGMRREVISHDRSTARCSFVAAATRASRPVMSFFG